MSPAAQTAQFYVTSGGLVRRKWDAVRRGKSLAIGCHEPLVATPTQPSLCRGLNVAGGFRGNRICGAGRRQRVILQRSDKKLRVTIPLFQFGE